MARTIIGTVIGALIIAVIQYGLVFINVEPFWQFIAVGTVIVISVLVDQAQRITRGLEPQALLRNATGRDVRCIRYAELALPAVAAVLGVAMFQSAFPAPPPGPSAVVMQWNGWLNASRAICSPRVPASCRAHGSLNSASGRSLSRER